MDHTTLPVVLFLPKAEANRNDKTESVIPNVCVCVIFALPQNVLKYSFIDLFYGFHFIGIHILK